MGASPPPIVLARPRARQLGLTAVLAAMVVAAIALPIFYYGPGVASFVLLLAAAGLAVGLISTISSVVSPRPALVVGDDGIEDRTSLFGVGLVRWREIEGLATMQIITQRSFLILLRDPRSFAARLGPLPRAAVKLNGRLSPAPICIPAAMLPVRVDALLVRIRERYGDQLAAHGIWVRLKN